MKVGIIGFGRLGKLIARYLQEDAEVIVYDKNYIKAEVEKVGAKWGELDEVCQCPIIIPFVPISALEEVIVEIKDKIKPGTLIADVCSVKELPISILEKHLPENIQILGTHPMFGPDSAAETVFGQKIVLCKTRIEEKLYSDIKKYLQSHGLKVVEATPAEHDEQISHSLVLSHFIGRALMDIGAKRLEIETLGYKRLMKILKTVENDSWQLFEDMNKYNNFAESARKEFIDAITKIDKKVHK